MFVHGISNIKFIKFIRCSYKYVKYFFVDYLLNILNIKLKALSIVVTSLVKFSVTLE